MLHSRPVAAADPPDPRLGDSPHNAVDSSPDMMVNLPT
jgi:hypothetical protein